MITLTQEETMQKLILWLEEFIADWGLDENITPETKFNDDLCFSSVDMLHYLAVIDMNFKKKFPYEKLILKDGAYRNELAVAEIADFVYSNWNIDNQEPKPL